MQRDNFGTDARAIQPLSRLVGSAQAVIWMTDVTGRCIHWNSTPSMSAAAPNAPLLDEWRTHIHPDDIALVRTCIADARAAQSSYQVEYRLLLDTGASRWMLESGVPRLSADGACEGYDGTILTLPATCRERIERESHAELKKSEERFRRLTELSTDWYWEANEVGQFTFFSTGLEKVLSLDYDKVLGKRREDFAVAATHPTVVAYQERIAQRASFRNLSFVSRHPSTGRIIYSVISGEPVYEDSVFTGYRGVGRDVSEETEVLDALRRLADEKRAFIENSPDIMMLFSEGGRILRTNQAVKDVLGYESAELVGRHYLEFVTPDTAQPTRDTVAAILERRAFVPDVENCWYRKDGSRVNLSWAVRRSSDKALVYATARDVTDAHRIQEQLQRAHQQVNTVLESIGDAFFSVDAEWRVTYANHKATEFVGLERGSAIGKPVWEAVKGISEASVFPFLEHAMQTRENTFFETFYEPAHAWVNVRAYPHEEGLSVFFHDVTARHNVEEAVRESEERFREMIALTPTGYIRTDAQGFILDINPAYCAMSGYSREELMGRDILAFLPSCPVDGALKKKGGVSFVHAKEAGLRHKDGHLLHILTNLTIKRDAEGNALSLTAFVTNISARKEVERQLEQLATHDMLTGLPNRILVSRRVQSMLDTVDEEDSLAVMFVDLDRFKQVNDSLGHAPGDSLLRQVALRLERLISIDDVVGRLGGDEFVLALRCADGRKSAAAMAETVLSDLSAPFDVEGHEVYVSASIGIAMFGEGGRSKDTLFQNADMAMYQAKAAGRSTYRFFEEKMSVAAKRRMTLEYSLRHALEREEFELHYQPRVDLTSLVVVGMEALIRWNHPQLGRISPLEFIPIAEERGFIEAIGQWALEEACRQTSCLVAKTGRKLHVSVNLSARQLKCADLVEQVDAALQRAKLPAELLELELTESALIDDMDASAAVLQRLKELGIAISVDDFGTGYSGLSYLRRFPVDILKLDRSFVHQSHEGVSHAEFIKAFVGMARALNLSVVAEGIETEDTLALLRHAGCDEGQGYYFARPLPLSALHDYLVLSADAKSSREEQDCDNNGAQHR